MWCTKCNHDLNECTCDDIDERFESLKNDDNFIFKMCRKCGLHYNRCKCDEPDWTTSHDGVELEEAQGKTLDKIFKKMGDNYEERKVDRFEEDELIIDTAAINDSEQPYETAIKSPFYNDGKFFVVELYNTKEEAEEGHKRWVEKMTANALPHELIDASTSWSAKLLDTMADPNNPEQVKWRTKKGGV